MHALSLIKDEGLYGHLARNVFVNGFDDHVKGLSKLLSQTQHSIVGYRPDPSKLPHLFQHLEKEIHMLSAQQAERHLGYHGTKSGEDDLLAFSYGRATRRYWRSCNLCEVDDLAKYGVAHWHQHHQLPTSLFCAYHHVPLEVYHLPKKLLHNDFWLPAYAEGIPQDIDADSYHLVEIAKVGEQALKDSQLPHAIETIEATLISGLRKIGCMTNTGKLKRYLYLEKFRQFYGERFERDMQCCMGIGNPLHLLKGILTQGEAIPLFRVILVHWLFGTWRAFKQHCLWMETFTQGRTSASKLEGKWEALKERYRTACINYLNTTGKGRSEFLKDDYRAFKWLLNNDRMWLDKQMPQMRMPKQLELVLVKTTMISSFQ